MFSPKYRITGLGFRPQTIWLDHNWHGHLGRRGFGRAGWFRLSIARLREEQQKKPMPRGRSACSRAGGGAGGGGGVDHTPRGTGDRNAQCSIHAILVSRRNRL